MHASPRINRKRTDSADSAKLLILCRVFTKLNESARRPAPKRGLGVTLKITLLFGRAYIY